VPKNIQRPDAERDVRRLLRQSPIVAVLGPRQVGKTTLARIVAAGTRGPTTTFDLEDPRDVARLQDPMLALGALRGLVILDEVQRQPELLPVLRVLADRAPLPCRFLILGSASPTLLRTGAESLAGRIAFHELRPFSQREVGADQFERLWRRGGYPRAFLARSEQASVEWRRDFIRTFLERDIPEFGIAMAPATMRRFWQMLAHVHGNILNTSALARSFGVADTTIRRYIDVLEGTFMLRTLPPFFANITKRQVRSPKVYLSDSGLLHTLLDVDSAKALDVHPSLGASWEGFLLETVVSLTRARTDQCYFWATQAGAELDLLIVDGTVRRGFEFKRTTTPAVTPSMRRALEDLKLDRLDVVHAGAESFQMAPRVYAVSATKGLDEIAARGR
jgi:uncharacterized protein